MSQPPFGMPPPGMPPPGMPPRQSASTPQGPDIIAAFTWAWRKFSVNPMPWIFPVLLIGILDIVLFLITRTVIHFIFGDGFALDTLKVNPVTGNVYGGVDLAQSRGFFVTWFLRILTALPLVFATFFLMPTLVKCAMQTAVGHRPDINEPFVPPPNAAKAFILSALLGVATCIGLLFCVLPGIVIGFLTMFSLYFLIDEGQEPLDAIKASVTFFMANIGPVLLLCLGSSVVVFLGFVLCCLGLVVAVPLALLATAYVFRILRHRPVAA